VRPSRHHDPCSGTGRAICHPRKRARGQPARSRSSRLTVISLNPSLTSEWRTTETRCAFRVLTPKFSAFGKATAGSFRLICSRSEDCPAHLISFAGGAGPGDGGLDLNHQLAERNCRPALLGSSQGHSRLYPLALVGFWHGPDRTRSFAIPCNHLRSGSWNTRSGWFLHLFGYGQRLRRPYL